MYIDKNYVSDKTFYPTGLMCKGTYSTLRSPMVITFSFVISFIWFRTQLKALEREKH